MFDDILNSGPVPIVTPASNIEVVGGKVNGFRDDILFVNYIDGNNTYNVQVPVPNPKMYFTLRDHVNLWIALSGYDGSEGAAVSCARLDVNTKKKSTIDVIKVEKM